MDKAYAFLVQARSDFKVFEQLWDTDTNDVPECHALQHLQMATEKLAKSIRLYLEPSDSRTEYTHVAFRNIAQVLRRPEVARKLGYSAKPEWFARFIEAHRDWFTEVEQLCPSIGTEATNGNSNGPNTEYPWLGNDKLQNQTWLAPAESKFPIARKLRSRDGIAFIELIRKLLERVPGAVING